MVLLQVLVQNSLVESGCEKPTAKAPWELVGKMNENNGFYDAKPMGWVSYGKKKTVMPEHESNVVTQAVTMLASARTRKLQQ